MAVPNGSRLGPHMSSTAMTANPATCGWGPKLAYAGAVAGTGLLREVFGDCSDPLGTPTTF